MGDWIDDMFDGGTPRNLTDQNHYARKYAARLVETSTLGDDERDDLIDTLLDERIDVSNEEVQDIIVRMHLNQKEPMQFYAPSKREISAFIKKVCDL